MICNKLCTASYPTICHPNTRKSIRPCGQGRAGCAATLIFHGALSCSGPYSHLDICVTWSLGWSRDSQVWNMLPPEPSGNYQVLWNMQDIIIFYLFWMKYPDIPQTSGPLKPFLTWKILKSSQSIYLPPSGTHMSFQGFQHTCHFLFIWFD